MTIGNNHKKEVLKKVPLICSYVKALNGNMREPPIQEQIAMKQTTTRTYAAINGGIRGKRLNLLLSK